jgi:phosphatidylserine decarboxylase
LSREKSVALKPKRLPPAVCTPILPSVSTKAQPVRYYDRRARRVAEEAVYGEGWLRFSYGNPVGRLATGALVRRAWFSALFGAWMNTRASARNIPGFVARYGIDMTRFETPEAGWGSFNEFFSRKIKPEAHRVAPGDDTVVLPADGRHLAYPDGADLSGLVVKGRPFTLAELLGDAVLAQRFEGGALVVSRLCPTDYHRFHFPLAGTPGKTVRLPGPLDSVSPIAIRAGARCLCANKRELTLLETPRAGAVALVEVGAACVGRIEQTFRPDEPVAKGAEKGYFLFGGSTVVTVFEPGRVALDYDLVQETAAGMESYDRMGASLGKIVS